MMCHVRTLGWWQRTEKIAAMPDWIFFIGLWLPVVALVVYDVIRNEPNEEDASCAGLDNSHHARERLHWRRQERFNGFTGLFTFIAALAAVTAAGFAGYAYTEARRQAKAAEDQLGVQKDTEERQLRAYVILNNDFKLAEGFRAGGTPHVRAILENVGQTPVYDLTWVSGFNVRPYPLNEQSTYDTCDALLAQPNANRWFFGKSTEIEKFRPSALTADDMLPVLAGNSAIYFHGRICYRDIFKKARQTDFCVSFRGENPKDGNFCERENRGN
jgi:hypothetical protein